MFYSKKNEARNEICDITRQSELTKFTVKMIFYHKFIVTLSSTIVHKKALIIKSTAMQYINRQIRVVCRFLERGVRGMVW